MSTFKGQSEDGCCTYEIVLSKSLEHTGKFQGIEDGLNWYDKKERIKEFLYSILNVPHSFIRIFKR